jgi:hypothetical protein
MMIDCSLWRMFKALLLLCRRQGDAQEAQGITFSAAKV